MSEGKQCQCYACFLEGMPGCELEKARKESAYDQRNAAMSQAESMKLLMDNAELRTAIECAMGAIRNMPCGGIGPDGATMEELNEAAQLGSSLENDAVYHTSQEVFRILEAADGRKDGGK